MFYSLAHCLLLPKVQAFRSFAPLGGEQTAAQLPGDWVSIGHSRQWLWYSVYARYCFLAFLYSQKLPQF